MQDEAKKLVQALPDTGHLLQFANSLRQWLVDDLNYADPNRSDEPVPEFTESRAKALLRAADLLDDPTRHSFDRLLENEIAVRVALFDLLQESELAEDEMVAALCATSAVQQDPEADAFNQWLSLFVAAHAWKNGYPLFQLDPASPPDPYSPAGQVLKRAAYSVRSQVQRSATERDKLGRQLAYTGMSGPPGLDELQADGTIAPLPPHYRPPIPVNYPEISSEMIQVDPQSSEDPLTGIRRGEPITITGDDLEPESPPPATHREPIQISPAEPSPAPAPQVVTPDATVSPSPVFSRSVQRRYGRGRQPMKTTKLHVIVQEYPDGPGLYGLQVRVRCKGIGKAHVSGTTSRDGAFTCELPVPENMGLTYDVYVSWPREFGGKTESKSVTLNADRTRFTLPFFHHLSRESDNQLKL